jgi:spore coat protein U-like protein
MIAAVTRPSHTVHGRIAGGQNPTVRSYSDTITVMLAF